MDKLVSVIVPIYKVEDYLKNCVDSIIAQTYSELEIILVDDGSPDNCGRMCDEYCEKDSRIRVIHKKNGGLSDARNAGIASAKGQFITCIDSDDYISPDYIEYLLTLLLENNADMSICGFVKTESMNEKSNSEEHSVQTYNSEEAIATMLYAQEFTTSAWGKLYRTELFDNIQYPVGKYSEDMFTTYRLLAKCSRIVCGDRVCYYYLRRPQSILTESFSVRHYDVFEALHIIKNSEFYNDSEIIQKAYKCQIVSSMAELLEKRPPSSEKLTSLWKESRGYLLTVFADKKAPKRVRAFALLMLFGKRISMFVITKYYSFKWRNKND